MLTASKVFISVNAIAIATSSLAAAEDPSRPARNGFERVDAAKEKACLEDPNISFYLGSRGTYENGAGKDQIPGDGDMCAYWCGRSRY